MIIETVCWSIAAILAATTALCFRVSNWYRQEADYWWGIVDMVRTFPELHSTNQKVLIWCNTHPPSILERLRGWVPPHSRMRQAETR